MDITTKFEIGAYIGIIIIAISVIIINYMTAMVINELFYWFTFLTLLLLSLVVILDQIHLILIKVNEDKKWKRK